MQFFCSRLEDNTDAIQKDMTKRQENLLLGNGSTNCVAIVLLYIVLFEINNYPVPERTETYDA